MTMNGMKLYGTILALLAALFNGTVGVFSVNLFATGISSEGVAFYKSFIALIIIFGVLAATGQLKALKAFFMEKWKPVAVCALFGFFILYYFETAAYQYINVAVVVFCLFGVSTITTFLLNCILERRFTTIQESISILLAVGGLYLVFVETNNLADQNSLGIVLASISGIGYACFLVLTKRLNIGGGLIPVCALLVFGVIYLFIPFAIQGVVVPVSEAIPYLLMLAILPTIGGFWCTTKSLTLIESQSVQLIELSEPIFALIIGFIFLGQMVTGAQMIGGGLIMASIIVHEYLPFGTLFKSRA